ncbi:MAG: FAD-dependent oxidoreductase [Thermoproteota archaeon]|nr:FAD-dependent oxidoreductase [Candidatus Brockarchaeota archaeon]
MKQLIIIGGGYAGTEVIRQLVLRGVNNIQVELISASPFFENTIAGTEVISEKLRSENLRYDLKLLSSYWGFNLTVARVKEVDLDEKTVKLENGQRSYDILVVASGSAPNFYNIKGAGLAATSYRLSDFELINSRLKQLASDHPSIVIAGAGYVGLEVAAEITDLLASLDRRARVTVVEKMQHVLPGFGNEPARRMAVEALASKGVVFSMGKGVMQISENSVMLEDGSRLESDLTIWSGGVKASDLASNIRGASLRNGYVEVDQRLLIKGRNNAFAIGDLAYVSINGNVAQKMAAEALGQAATVARNIASMVNGEAPKTVHKIDYPVDFPKVLLSVGGGKAILIFGPQYASIGNVEYFLKRRIDIDEMVSRFPSL